MSDIDLSELNTLAVDLHQAGQRAGAQASAALRKTTLDIEATAKAFVPVDTGNLKSSIGHDFTGDGRSGVMEAEIGPTADYGAHVEYGVVGSATGDHAPAAYMGPAVDRHGWQLVAALGQIGGDVL